MVASTSGWSGIDASKPFSYYKNPLRDDDDDSRSETGAVVDHAFTRRLIVSKFLLTMQNCLLGKEEGSLTLPIANFLYC